MVREEKERERKKDKSPKKEREKMGKVTISGPPSAHPLKGERVLRIYAKEAKEEREKRERGDDIE